jgi:phosphohistidine phosphatase
MLLHSMIRNLALLRHGLASGQGPEAELLPEGRDYLRRLAARLDGEGWRPAAIVTSPYRRARETAEVLASGLGVKVETLVLPDLVPEAEPDEALAAILEAVPVATPVLVVTHLPLVGRLMHELTGDEEPFSPGTFVEVAREGQGDARRLRRIGPRDLNGNGH